MPARLAKNPASATQRTICRATTIDVGRHSPTEERYPGCPGRRTIGGLEVSQVPIKDERRQTAAIVRPMSTPTPKSAYAAAGVDIDAQEAGLARVKKLAKSTFTPGVLTEIGSFGGLFRPELAGMTEPVLVASADGVGTKLVVARMAGNYSLVGRDLVNHCVNDILVQGAEPLFFMDYLGAGVLEPEKMVELVSGVADGCRENGCALLGGETAEMPGFYQP